MSCQYIPLSQIGFFYLKHAYKFFAFLTLFFSVGCSKLVELDPPATSITGTSVFENDKSAIAFITGTYATIGNSGGSTNGPLSMNFGTAAGADELDIRPTQTDVGLIACYKNTLTSSFATASFIPWYNYYPLIYNANTAIEALQDASKLTPAVREQLLGESKFMRAFCYFYLVNLYGDVPLVLSRDYKINAVLPRSSKTDVYAQIISDLKEAKELLSDEFLDATLLKTTSEHLRPTKWAAAALLARVYLYISDYTHAESEASYVLEHPAFSLPTLANAFTKNNSEAIFQIQSVRVSNNTQEGLVFILPAAGPSISPGTPFFLSNIQLNSFESGDLRKLNWTKTITAAGGTTYSYPYKYKLGAGSAPLSEYSTVLRMGELYLIRAEARIMQENIEAGIADLNILRDRATDKTLPIEDPNRLPILSLTLSQTDALIAVAHERQVELFTEWGDRWFNLKRTAKIDEAMTIAAPFKGTVWNSHQQLYPIPQAEILRNPSLVNHQNPGYN